MEFSLELQYLRILQYRVVYMLVFFLQNVEGNQTEFKKVNKLYKGQRFF